MGEAALNATLLKKGAEASLFLADWHGRRVVVKARLPKRYRAEQLDMTIRRYRTVHEPQLMHEAKRAGVPTPTIFLVDVENASITMEYIEGTQIKQLLDGLSKNEREVLCTKIGELVARLHKCGVIHGDLTTSNMILSEGRVVLVDFGLGDKTFELEAQGVDLHLLKRALQSTHFQQAEACFSAILKSYDAEVGEAAAQAILEKIREIEKRGRYVAERKQET
jgi:TP53 regulating kinase and related kinases